VRGQEFLCDPWRGFVFSYPSMGPSRIEVDAGGARLTVMLLRTGIERQLAALLGRPPDSSLMPPIEFAPAIDLATGYGRNIARYAQLAFTDIERRGPSAYKAVVDSGFEQFIITELLLWHPHNYSGALQGPAPSILPRDVRRAIDYIQAHLSDPITLTDIIAAAGVPGRTLFKHFEDHHGTSPARYLREARFDKVREGCNGPMRRRASLGSQHVLGSVTWVASPSSTTGVSANVRRTRCAIEASVPVPKLATFDLRGAFT